MLDRDEGADGYTVVRRLRSTGVYHDPNDLSMVLVLGILLVLSHLADRRLRMLLPLILGATAAFAYALVLTKSRGRLLALMAGVLTLLQARYGLKRAALLATGVLPALLLLFRGRQTDIGSALGSDTGQARVQLWSEGLALFRQSPLFGIGQGEYSEQVG